MRELSLCGLALLGVVVDHRDGIGFDALYRAVPAAPRIDSMPGQIESWPHDVAEWTDELQALLDRKLVTRAAASDQFLYVATTAGEIVLRAALHPRGNTMESLA